MNTYADANSVTPSADGLRYLILLDRLDASSIFSLLKICLRHRPISIYYLSVSRLGLQFAILLRKWGLITREAKLVEDLYLTDTPDCVTWSSFYKSMKACVEKKNQILNVLQTVLKNVDPFFLEVCTAGVWKDWQLKVDNLLLQENLARSLARSESVSAHRVFLITECVAMLRLVKMNLHSETQILGGSTVVKTIVYLLYPLVASLGLLLKVFFQKSVHGPKPKPSGETLRARIGVGAAWGFHGMENNRVDDLFWWRGSPIPANRLLYLFQRQDFQPTRKRLSQLNSMGIEPVVLNPKFCGEAPHLLVEPLASVVETIQKIRHFGKFAIRGLVGEYFSRSVLAKGAWQSFKTEKLRVIYQKLGIRIAIHHDEAGLETVNLATQLCDGTRLGTHWSCFTGPNHSTTRCHDVYFVWGIHDLQIILDSGSASRNLLISGCFLNDLSNKEAFRKGREAVGAMRRQRAVRYVITLLDSSPSVPNFYRFFLRWLLEDPELGLIIKSKGTGWEEVLHDGLDGLTLQAQKSGRLHVFSPNASPSDAALLSDFSVGVFGISAVVSAALNGARVLYLDYEKLDQGVLNPYCLLHSLGPNRCVFYNPDSLRQTVLEQVKNPTQHPDLGNVSPLLDRIDPFRDGKASQRIGEYIQYFMEGLENRSREDAIRAANQQYAEKWGADKVVRQI